MVSNNNFDTKTTGFSIVTAVKNEADIILNLIKSVKSLDYQNEIFELIIVDDNSTDGTFEVVKNNITGSPNINIYKVTGKEFTGKRGALDFGISKAKFPYIIITDADCMPQKNWLRGMAEKFSSGCDFVFGIAPFYQNKTFVNKISCYENFRNSLITFSAANIGIPYSAAARNFGFKKESFEKIGGYKNTTDTLSGDDDLLLREAVKNKLKICTLTSPGAFVYSTTKKSFKDYFDQRARHTQTSLHYALKQKLFLFFWHILNITFLLSVLLTPLNALFIFPFSVKLILDVSSSFIYQKKFGYKFNLIEIIYLQILYELFLIVHMFNAKLKKVKWK